jgi:predicted nuclease of predicted toxin-antitoxin system
LRLKLDENLGRFVVELFREAGHDVATVWEEELTGATDHQIINIARSERRCLVTLDLDFANPLLFPPTEFTGVAVLRLPPKPNTGDLQAVCSTLLSGLARETVSGRLWIVEPGRIREYEPPESESSAEP